MSLQDAPDVFEETSASVCQESLHSTALYCARDITRNDFTQHQHCLLIEIMVHRYFRNFYSQGPNAWSVLMSIQWSFARHEDDATEAVIHDVL